MTEIENLDLHDHACGGFVVARPRLRAGDLYGGGWADVADPGPLLTVSGCIGDVLPQEWMFSWLPEPTAEERRAGAAAWGIALDAIEDLVAWVRDHGDGGHLAFPELFRDLPTVQEFVRRFLPADCGGRVLGLGLARNDIEGLHTRCVELAARYEVQPHAASLDLAMQGPSLDLVLRGASLPMGGRPLGYEVLDLNPVDRRHSWYCHDLAGAFHNQLGIRPGPSGLLRSLEEAHRVANWYDDPASGAEEGAWSAWLLVEYDSHPAALGGP